MNEQLDNTGMNTKDERNLRIDNELNKQMN